MAKNSKKKSAPKTKKRSLLPPHVRGIIVALIKHSRDHSAKDKSALAAFLAAMKD